MDDRLERIDRAIECVKQEQKRLHQEAEAFEAFRELIGRAPASHSGNTQTEMGTLLEAYQEQVFRPLDYEEVYGDTCAESIKAELTPSLAIAMTENQPLTQERKRNLLVATNGAVDSRNVLCESLDREQDSLERIQRGLSEIESELSILPSCSLRKLSFEKFVDVWESSEELIDQCDRLAEARQGRLQEFEEAFGKAHKKEHAINDLLYAGLETRFPALRTITEVRQSIEEYREGECTPTDSPSDDECEPVIVDGTSD